MMQEFKFSTESWRAKFTDGFNDENVILIAEAFSKFLIQKKSQPLSVAIGFDGRKNSQHSAELFAKVLSANEISVLLSLEIIPTPILSFAVKQYQCSAGIMVTASHNPPNYNGIKFKDSHGGPFISNELRQIQTLIQEPVLTEFSDKNITIKNFLPEYISHLRNIIDFATVEAFAKVPSNNASVIIDSMGGAGKTILEDILVELGWRAQTIFGSPEPNFYDRLPEPIEKNLEPLKYNTSVTDALFGIATDGDADRCSIVYEDGTWMSVQETILALLWHLHTNKKWKGAVIKSCPISDKVRLMAERWKQNVFDVNVGFRNLAQKMVTEDFLFAAEESGGFGFKNHIPERDGILTGLIFCEMIAVTGKSLRQIMNEIYSLVGKLHYKRIDIKVENVPHKDLLKNLMERNVDTVHHYPVLELKKYMEADDITGLKYLLGDSRWLLFRVSQTEPVVRIYAEGQNANEVDALLAMGRKMIEI